MNYIAYIAKFIYRIKWWLIIPPLLVGYIVYIYMGQRQRLYKSTTTIYTGIVSGYDITTFEGARQDWNVINNAMDNLMNIILSQSTLKNVSMRLYARNLMHMDPEHDNQYLSARSSRWLQGTPADVMALVDYTSEDKTIENLLAYEVAEHGNHVYGIFHWNAPYYCYSELSKIKVKRVANSDMLEVSYQNYDPSIVYNTLEILNDEFVQQYRLLRFGETNNVIKYFEEELARVGGELLLMEDSLRDYNVAHRIINYDEQTKHIAALDRDFELRYEEILLNNESAEMLRNTIETQLKDLQIFKNNAQFIEKLHSISNLYSRISTAEVFKNDEDMAAASTTTPGDLQSMRGKLEEEKRNLQQITSNIASQQYTKEGVSTNSMISQWLDAVLQSVKTGAELDVMKQRRTELDNKYTHFSPLGSTLKRKGREINFTEQSYLSILQALNTARLRQKNLQMTSATLKIINPPVMPISAEPSKRRLMVALAIMATLAFILAFFILIELLDRTLRDKVRAERLTKGKVIGALPGAGELGQRRYIEQHKQIAAKFIGNAATDYFSPENKPNIVNVLSTEHGDGKSTVMEYMATYYREAGMKVRIATWGSDFNAAQKSFMLATTVTDFIGDKEGEVSVNEADVVLVEYPPLTDSTISKELLRCATLNLVIAPANRTWKDTDQLLFEKLEAMAGEVPVAICLNSARRDAVQTFTGMLPPYTFLRRLGYQISQFGFTAVK